MFEGFQHLNVPVVILFFELSLAGIICLVGFIIDKIRQVEGWNNDDEEEEMPRFLPARPWPNLLRAKHAPVVVVVQVEDHLPHETSEPLSLLSDKKKKMKNKEKEHISNERPEELYDVQFLRSPHGLLKRPPVIINDNEKSLEIESTQNTNTVSERRKKKKKKKEKHGSVEKIQEKQKKKEAIKAIHYMESLLEKPVQ
ncbi:unnamed protein product [Bursaphelenchus xylophilus]|uniref:(pine wood nematode) hypothetical protein n=1 Tax=Bursaphelenchus xylophilus TaxID=6326 RepID=A0A1I7S8U4_BURXY|nr:unnamed protein product [Bursaphelenchus xylophilus]CAG9085872.1 unnamed protein product [Bursaphelenchus xylophilus]